MGHTINTVRYNEEIAQVVNSNNVKIKEAINGFNSQLNILGNGVTWKGGTSITNVGNLVDCYNTYKNAYTEFIRLLGEKCSVAFDSINSVIATNMGVQLSFDNIQALSFDTPKIEDLSFTGESGNADAIIDCANFFVQYASDIKNGYINIRNAFEKIGMGSQILDTSDYGTDYATILKNNVIEIVDGLKTIDENSFKTTIENLHTAAQNIKNG